ncbi:MAG: PBP1A family penicillin-binding protein [Deltaproteobacteria bacterium]|nr:PBP1A family penicillin-binding protein [Deltaproteobacteria bacterium]
MRDIDDGRTKPEIDGSLVSELRDAADGLDLTDLSDGTEIEPSLGPQAPTGPDPADGFDPPSDWDGLEGLDDDPGIGLGEGPAIGEAAAPPPGGENPGRGRGKKGRNGPGLPRPRGRGLGLRLFMWLFWTGTGLALFGLLVIFLGYAFFSQGLPSVDGLRNYRPKTVTFFYGLDGQVIGEYSHERRIVKPLSAMPEHLKQAYLATEDANFYQHGGINPVAIVRAAYNTVFEDHLQGASTITQQLVRSFLLSNERKIERKIKEMILAFRLEAVLNKDQIFELYLNQIYLGQGAYGVEAAAQTYFDKHVEQLTVAESAMLAGITQSPTGKNPVTKPEEARRRQMYALSRMQAVGYLTPQQAREAADEVLIVVGERPNPNTTVAPYFTEHVRRILAEKYGEDSLYNDGWKVYTTLSVRDQEAADAAVARGLWEYARRRGFRGPVLKLGDQSEIDGFRAQVDKKLGKGALVPNRLYQAVILALTENQGLRVAVGNFEGHVTKKNLEWILPKGALAKQLAPGDVVWVRLAPPGEPPEGPIDRQAALASIASGAGGTDLAFILEQRTAVQAALLSMDLSDGGVRAMVGGRDFGESQFNRATQSQRQPGSSFKPIVYTAAMDNGFTPGSVMIDGPVVIDDIGSQKRWKPLNSDQKFLGPMPLYNALVASRNLVSVKVLERIGFEALDKTARDLGIKTTLPHSPTVALGAHGVTMPEMITAYSSFPNLGLRVEPRYITRIEDRDGNVVETFDPVFYRAISPGTACVLTSMLRGVVAQGTGTSVKPLDRPVGGKTGTTNDASDAWFVGFTPEYVTAVWMGTDELKPRAVGEVGGRASGPIFLYYMRDVLKDAPIVDFSVPEDAEMTPGGAYGICYKKDTIGTGISETAINATPEENFLKQDLEEEYGQFGAEEDFTSMLPNRNEFNPM